MFVLELLLSQMSVPEVFGLLEVRIPGIFIFEMLLSRVLIPGLLVLGLVVSDMLCVNDAFAVICIGCNMEV